jgi:hypothetical protein
MFPEVYPQAIGGDPFIDDTLKLGLIFLHLLRSLGTFQLVRFKKRVLQGLYP